MKEKQACLSLGKKNRCIFGAVKRDSFWVSPPSRYSWSQHHQAMVALFIKVTSTGDLYKLGTIKRYFQMLASLVSLFLIAVPTPTSPLPLSSLVTVEFVSVFDSEKWQDCTRMRLYGRGYSSRSCWRVCFSKVKKANGLRWGTSVVLRAGSGPLSNLSKANTCPRLCLRTTATHLQAAEQSLIEKGSAGPGQSAYGK